MKNYRNGEECEEVWFELVFDDGHGNGYGFPCDEDGNVGELNEAAYENYMWCLIKAREDAEYFARSGEVIRRRHRWREPNSGECECGNRIELFNQYLGACECPYCGRWWNLFGQELNPPTTWSDGDDFCCISYW